MIRSLLFVPSRVHMLGKIAGLDADAYVIDLEDSIPQAKKDDALKEAASFLASEPKKKIYVRLDSKLLDQQIATLRQYMFEGYMLPKFERPQDFSSLEAELSRRKNIALAETPMGMVNIREIASCSWVSAIAFGAEDYTSAVGMENAAELLTGIKSRIVMFARAFGKFCYDTPFMILNDESKFLAEVNISADLGFDGKLAVHPRHVGVINEVFARRNNPEFMKEIVRQYDENGGGAVSIGGKIYEAMHIARFRKILGQEAV